MISSKKYTQRKKPSPPSQAISSHLNRIALENQKLQTLLLEATDKQHQEMTRAIQLKEKNVELEKLLHDAKQEVERPRHQSYESRLQELLEENEYLSREIVLARKKRLEANRYAEKVAEANYCLQNIYDEVCEQIQHLKRRDRKNEQRSPARSSTYKR